MEQKRKDSGNDNLMGDSSDIRIEDEHQINLELLPSDQQNKNNIYEKPINRSSNQFRSIFLKNTSLQMKQLGTNVCQILTPIICLALVVVIKELALSQIPGRSYSMPFPIILNQPEILSAMDVNGMGPFATSNCLQWFYYDFAENITKEDRKYIGTMGCDPDIDGTGILANTITNICEMDLATPVSCPSLSLDDGKRSPYFVRPEKVSHFIIQNNTINQAMYNAIKFLNSQPFQLFHEIPGLEALPDGAFFFEEVSKDKIKVRIQVNDLRINEYHRLNGFTKIMFNFPGVSKFTVLMTTEGQIAMLDLISRAYLHSIDESVWIMTGIQYMPSKDEDKTTIFTIINLTASCLYPLALSLLLPVFMYTIVLEKEERLLEMMKMNGMQMKYYWFVTYLFDAILYCITALVFFLIGYFMTGLDFFVKTDKFIIFLMLFGWGLSQISISIFFQVFISKSRTATIIGYILSIWTIIISITLNFGVYPDPYVLPIGLQLYPSFAFCRLTYLLSVGCARKSCYESLSMLTVEGQQCLGFLYLGAILFFFLGIYLHEIVPQEYGVAQNPLFFLNNFRTKSIHNKVHIEEDEEIIEEFTDLQEDEDSKKERRFVEMLNDDEFSDFPLICKSMKKVYSNRGVKNMAVKSLSLSVKPGEIFGLLGPNGAGKTTLISMITGLYKPTKGTAWISGHDITSDLNTVHLLIGVCPQFDLLWPELTVEEHLLFYARLKGIKKCDEIKLVQKAIEEVLLTPFRYFKSRELSGGMKRRLSVAISLVGEPKIIFLDEPTTGLDPETRRQLWDIIVELRGKRAIVLTTHSMEEADVLCSRIGIITSGVLRCVGPQVRLKSLYGGGYHLYINCMRERQQNENTNELGIENINFKSSFAESQNRVIDYIDNVLPKAKLVSAFNGNIIYKIPLEGFVVSRLFELLEDRKADLKISDWGISQSSLEDVFMEIVDSTE